MGNFIKEKYLHSAVPQDMRDSNIFTLYKNEVDHSNCNSYRGLSLLSIVGKVFARVALDRHQSLTERVYPDAQCLSEQEDQPWI